LAGSGLGRLAIGLLLTGFGVSFVLPPGQRHLSGAAPDGTAGAAGGLIKRRPPGRATLGVSTTGASVGICTAPASA
jgi:DHA2 family methylenomycin A resistance protein-like MFS transporter